MVASESSLLAKGVHEPLIALGWSRLGVRKTWTKEVGRITQAIAVASLRGTSQLEWGFFHRELAEAVHGQVPANAEVGWSVVHGMGIFGTTHHYKKPELPSDVLGSGLADALAAGTRAIVSLMAPIASATDLADFLLAWDFPSGKPFIYPGGRHLATMIAAGLLKIDGDPRAAAVLEGARASWQPAKTAATDERLIRMAAFLQG